MTINTHLKLIRRSEVLKMILRSKSSLQLDEEKGIFPRPVSIGGRAIAYIESEVTAVINARIEEQSNEDIMDLVRQLVLNRRKSISLEASL